MVTKLSWPDIVDLLATAMNRIILIMPAIHEEWADVIEYRLIQNENLLFKVCLDNSETVIRNGYGSAKVIPWIKENADDLKESADLRVNFICVDENAYCLFWESRNIAGDPQGFNAVQLELETAEKIINQFFPKVQNEEETETFSSSFNDTKAAQIKIALENNPPEQPDLKRQIETYKTHFQYAELYYEGGGIQSKTVSIPKDILPFQDNNIKKKMSGTYALFSKEETEKWEKLTEVQTEINRIRKEFLHPCKLKKNRSIIKKEDKEEFDNQVKKLSGDLNTKMESLYEVIQKAINNSEIALKNEWRDFFENNPGEAVGKIVDNELRKQQIEKMVNNVIYKIKFPDASALISKMNIKTDFAEFTIEDLSNVEFLQWFKEKKLINSENANEIATFEKAFEVKR